MAKASLVMLTRCLALHYAKENIRVNCISPGAIETPLVSAFAMRNPDLVSPDAYRAYMLETIPMGEWGKPDDIAQTALFLVSDAASYITGAIISVDGGVSAS